MANIFKNLNLFMDGTSYAGKVSTLTPPTLTIITEDYRPGGRDVVEKLDMGMEALEPSFELASYEQSVYELFGFQSGGGVSLVFRGATQTEEGTVKAVKITMRGSITSIDRGSWTPGTSAPTTVTVSASYYKEEIGAAVVVEIDVKNMKRIINGKDQLADMREALGF